MVMVAGTRIVHLPSGTLGTVTDHGYVVHGRVDCHLDPHSEGCFMYTPAEVREATPDDETRLW